MPLLLLSSVAIFAATVGAEADANAEAEGSNIQFGARLNPREEVPQQPQQEEQEKEEVSHIDRSFSWQISCMF